MELILKTLENVENNHISHQYPSNNRLTIVTTKMSYNGIMGDHTQAK